ncbi:ParB N-terminal domain-containing protein [Luteolibacter pohnpeiensis]|uniref:ParB N-terminal domain-containing protein n=1 Tax=Luteolibacter pohnpeiensis TaxID=454153 RepID=A0A934VYM9_9BACT|nr:ParB/Srx family N-terminal domain-containing protein [Luteolibacter pohnpeiensis]MBK1884689.1 ParB N-terminal domain-containing protein [Luteolibacter pohnpeiensis]
MESSKEQFLPEVKCSHKELLDPSSLTPHPRNPNKHGQKQIEMLARIIRHQGWRNPIVVSARSGFVIAGHGRLEAALLLGLSQVPVDVQEFASEADEWAHLVADNRIAELADMDKGGLEDLLRDLGEVDDFDLELTGFDASELDQMLSDETQADDIAEDEDASENACLLKFDGLSIPVTEAERVALRRQIDQHAEATGSYFGFVRQLLALEDDV